MMEDSLSIDTATAGLTQGTLRGLLRYEEETGQFVWRNTGAIAGHRMKSKKNVYVRIKLHGVSYLAHRLVYLYLDGALPAEQVDHVNGDGTDNRKTNLRLVSSAGNNQNSAMRCCNTTGITGVEWDNRQKRWVACIKVGGKRIHLGSFTSKDEAARVRRDAEINFGFHSNHGKTKQERRVAAECEVA